MAIFKVTSVIDYRTKGRVTSTDWEVSEVSDFSTLIDFSYLDRVNVTEWRSPLPKADGSGFHADLDAVYARVRQHFDDAVSPWYVCEVKNQNDQQYDVTLAGVVIYTLDGLTANIT